MGLDYTPPNGDSIAFELPGSYTPPDGDDIQFWLAYDQSSVVRKMLVQEYSLRTSAGLVQSYSVFSAHLVVSLSQLYGLRTSAKLEQRYGDAPLLLRWLDQWYGDAAQLQKALIQKYDDAYQVHSVLEQPYVLPAFLLKTLEQRYSIAGVELLSTLQQLYDIKTVDLVRRQLVQPFTLGDGEGQIYTPDSGDGVVVNPPSGGTSPTVPNTVLKYYHLNIEATVDQYCMSCEVHLTSQADYVSHRVLDDLTLTVGGDAFEFFVESKQRNRGHGTAEYVIKGLSKTALFDAPYVEPITADLSGMASVIAAGLWPGYTVNWNTVDWHIPADTLMVADQTPLAIIRDIAGAAGAVVLTEPDGTLTVEPMYPVAVNNWPAAAIDHHLSDALDFFTTGEDYDHRPGYNRYLISDHLTSDDSMRLEEEAITSATKYIRAYQTPWADNFTIRHTGGDWVTIEPLGIEERLIEDEIIEFVNGSGRTSYPIYSVVMKECYPGGPLRQFCWLEANLGTVTFAEDGTLQSAVAGESLLKISYRTKCRKYLATDHEDEQVQLVAEGVD